MVWTFYIRLPAGARDFYALKNVKTCPRAYPVSSSMGIRVLSEGKAI
jgi:hypothetical protein